MHYHSYHTSDLHVKRASFKKDDKDKKRQGNWHKTPGFAPYHPEDILSWLKEELVLDSAATIPKSTLFQAYENFCISRSFRQMTPNIFGKFMFFHYPTIQSCRPGQAGKQQTHYKGIAWSDSSRVAAASASSFSSKNFVAVPSPPPSDSSYHTTPAHSCPSSPDYYSSSEDEISQPTPKQQHNNLTSFSSFSSSPTITTTTTTTTTCTARFLPSLQQVLPNNFPYPQHKHESQIDHSTTLPPLSSLRLSLHTDIGAFSVSTCLPQPHSHIRLPQRPPRKDVVDGLTEQDQPQMSLEDDSPAGKKTKPAWLKAILREKARKEYEFDLLEDVLLECLNSLKTMCKENHVRRLTQEELHGCLERLQPMTLASSLWMYCEHLKHKDPKRAQTQYLICLNAFRNQSKTEHEILVAAHILGASSDLWLSLDCAKGVIAYLLQEAAKANPNSLLAELKAQKHCAEFYLDCTELPNNSNTQQRQV